MTTLATFKVARYETNTAGAPDRVWLEGVFKANDGDTREVEGLFAPYGVSIPRRSWALGTNSLSIEQSALTVRENATAFYNHDWQLDGTPIGRIARADHIAGGLNGAVSFSRTAKADEIYTLCQDGVLDRFSIGMSITDYRISDADTDNPELVVTGGEVFEVSIVPFPAFDDARINSVNNSTDTKGENPMPPIANEAMTREAGDALADDVQTLSTALDRIEAQVATLGHAATSTAAREIPFDSYAEYIHALATRDETAQKLLLDYEGGTIGDLGDMVKDGWLGDLTSWVEQSRTVMNLFDSGQMPDSGMGVEYGFLDTDTTDVTEQLDEGDVLEYGAITFDTARAPIKTYGGYGEMSVQEVERSPFDVTETFFKALALRYAKVTETVVRGTALNASAKAITADLDDADGWLDFIADASFHLDDKGLAPEFILVGRDMWKSLAKLRDGDATDAPRLLDRSSGRLSVTGLTGDLFSVPVIPINTGATTGVVRVCNSWAIRTFESGGAPLRLQDGDITNLTKAFSVYGYLAAAVIDAEAIVKPTV